MIDNPWLAYRKCTVCLQPTGSPCKATSGRVSHGRPDGVAVELAVPHPSRKRRSRRIRVPAKG